MEEERGAGKNTQTFTFNSDGVAFASSKAIATTSMKYGQKSSVKNQSSMRWESMDEGPHRFWRDLETKEGDKGKKAVGETQGQYKTVEKPEIVGRKIKLKKKTKRNQTHVRTRGVPPLNGNQLHGKEGKGGENGTKVHKKKRGSAQVKKGG